MLIPDLIRKCVVHLYEDDPAEPGRKRPVGTAFGLCIELDHAPGHSACYLVTARHVVNGVRSGSGMLYARFNQQGGGTLDVPVAPDDWVSHRATDIAAIPLAIGPDVVEFKPLAADVVAPDDFVRNNRVGEGDDVFFVGLFTQFPGRIKNQPIIRFGKIALARHEPIAIRSDPAPDADVMSVDAYLVETHSWGGSSGAPAFVYFEPSRRQWSRTHADAPLLGLVHGHYEIDAAVKFPGDIRYGDENGRVGINTGIAIVIPASAIMELLMYDELAAARKAMVIRRDDIPIPD